MRGWGVRQEAAALVAAPALKRPSAKRFQPPASVAAMAVRRCFWTFSSAILIPEGLCVIPTETTAMLANNFAAKVPTSAVA